jgi:hypothetical protein
MREVIGYIHRVARQQFTAGGRGQVGIRVTLFSLPFSAGATKKTKPVVI